MKKTYGGLAGGLSAHHSAHACARASAALHLLAFLCLGTPSQAAAGPLEALYLTHMCAVLAG